MLYEFLSTYVNFSCASVRRRYITVHCFSSSCEKVAISDNRKHLHKSYGFKDPIKDNWQVEHLLQGVKRVLGVAQGCANLITPDMLLCLKKHLNMYKLFHLSVWSACLIGVFGMLRPGNFLRRDKSVPVLRICQLESRDMDYLITFDYTKTIQFREKQLQVFMPYLPEHPLCPASALFRLLIVFMCCLDQMDRLHCYVKVYQKCYHMTIIYVF